MSAAGDVLPVVLAADDAVELCELLNMLATITRYDRNFRLEDAIERYIGSSYYGIDGLREDVLALRRVLAKAMR